MRFDKYRFRQLLTEMERNPSILVLITSGIVLIKLIFMPNAIDMILLLLLLGALVGIANR